MKRIIVLLVFNAIFLISHAQKTVVEITREQYSKFKKENRLDSDKFQYKIKATPDAKPMKLPKIHQVQTAGQLACAYIPPTTPPIGNWPGGSLPDDDGVGPINLPFTFCFYGTNYNQIYINTNGNITFNSSYTTFTATGFPTSGVAMIAPFWADFDFGSGVGDAYYQINPTNIIISWDSLGYYNSYSDKLNSCQLILTDGLDPILPAGNNVAFLYRDMNWTTGDASGGSNGFGGTAATVGINKGNGTTFVQIGRFSTPGSTFTSNTATNSGIDWLDNKAFFFNTCTGSSNIAPVSTDVSFCDTIRICGSDTLILDQQFLAPETSQLTTISVSAPTLGSSFTILNNTPGSTANITTQIIASAALAGVHYVNFTATDNGTPAATTNVTQIIEIVTDSSMFLNPVITVNPTPTCAGTPATLNLQNCSSYTDILWNNASTGCTITAATSGIYYTTLMQDPDGCKRTTFRSVVISPTPTPSIAGVTNFCNSNGTTLSANISGGTLPISNYNWSVPGSTNNDSVVVFNSGTVTLTVTDANGCTGTANITVTNNTPPVTITSNFTSFCPGQPVTLTASLSGGSYAWSGPGGPFMNAQTITVNPVAASTYSVTATVNGCVASNQITLNPLATPVVTATVAPYCAGTTTTVSASVSPAGSYTYNWQPGNFSTSSITTGSAGTYTVTASVGSSCPGQTVVTVQAPNPNPVAAITTQSGPNIICHKGTQTLNSAVISGTPAYTYAWSPAVVPASPTNASSYTVPNAGTYQLVVTDQNNCKDTATITLIEITPTVNVYSPGFICEGDTALIYAQGQSTTPVTYDWQPLAGANDSIWTTAEGTYGVTVTDQNGCTANAVTGVAYYPHLNGLITANPVSPSEWGQTITITDQSVLPFGTIDNWAWDLGDGTSDTSQGPLYHDYAAPGTYTITLTTVSEFGCVDTVQYQHEVDVIIPHINIITPNGDNVNNKLEFRGVQFIANNKLSIYDRWGKKIYEKSNYDNSWNADGHSDGTYYYILELPNYRREPFGVIKENFQISR